VFQVKPRKRGIGRNPRTGKEVASPGRTIRFKPGKDLQNIGGSSVLVAALSNHTPSFLLLDDFPELSTPACPCPSRARPRNRLACTSVCFILTLITATLLAQSLTRPSSRSSAGGR
jgi:hypothetical protein